MAILKMRKLRLKEVKFLFQSHRASEDRGKLPACAHLPDASSTPDTVPAVSLEMLLPWLPTRCPP